MYMCEPQHSSQSHVHVFLVLLFMEKGWLLSVAASHRKVSLGEAGRKGKYLSRHQKIVLLCMSRHKRERPAGKTSLPELPFPSNEDETPTETEVSGEQMLEQTAKE